ncbi:MAG: protease modulator HflC [Deltaproteobacteria bacterium]
MNRLAGLLIALIALTGVGYGLACFQVTEWQQAVVLQFGKPVKTITEPGLYFKTPLVQNVMFFEKRLLEYDAASKELITQDKQQLVVDNYSRWRIIDPLKFYQTVGTLSGAQSRLDDIIYSNLREAIGRSTLRDVVSGDRDALMRGVTKSSDERAEAYGVRVVDVRIKRTDLPAKNEQNVFSRMRTERERAAKKFRAEGEEQSRKIRSKAEKDREIILAEAKREAAIIRGDADGQATNIYAKAYGRDPDFYEFMRTLEAYKVTLPGRTKLLLSPKGEFLRIFEKAE